MGGMDRDRMLDVTQVCWLAELLQNFKRWIVTYHEHDSLLENRPDEGLTEEERKAAWEEYENEKKGVFTNRGWGTGGWENQLKNAGQEYDATDVTITSEDMAKLQLELRLAVSSSMALARSSTLAITQ
ncbi:PREDICTED: uncharacterized protein LOC106812494 [Priapulus caudatus]|uniref:Uncharacterized protein LOC106812494 n=1 Tax=Priapulus caudatus TaxID=37621 RepID=A0ABM1EI48_PRICU|nr:PREDICTED: uncharacterized protein LOC106812494 [Priapulus caudatus]